MSRKSNPVYSWRPGVPLPKSKAPIVGAELARIQNDIGADSLRPEDVLDSARRESSPLHSMFEWNDTIAAHEHRLSQARGILRYIVVTVDDSTDAIPVRMFFNMKQGAGEQNLYIPTVRVMSDADLRKQLVATALSEADSWRRRYESLHELSRVFAELDRVRADNKQVKARARDIEASVI